MSTNDWLDGDGIGPVPDDVLSETEEEELERPVYQINFDNMTVYILMDDQSVIVKNHLDGSNQNFDSLDHLKEELPDLHQVVSTILQSARMMHDSSDNLNQALDHLIKSMMKDIDKEEEEDPPPPKSTLYKIVQFVAWTIVATIGAFVAIPFIDLIMRVVMDYWT